MSRTVSKPVTETETILTFAAYVRRHRSALGMTQEALAREAGISQSYVSGIERGVNVEVDPQYVHALADALGRDRAEALGVASSGVGYAPPILPSVPPSISLSAPRDRAPHGGELRNAVINLSEYEGFDDLDPELQADVIDDVAFAVERARNKQRRRENIGGSGAGRSGT